MGKRDYGSAFRVEFGTTEANAGCRQREKPFGIHIHIGSETISATPEHPFWVIGAGWTAAGELRKGSALLTKDGVVVNVDTIERREGKFKVYNFEVAGAHTYYVSAVGVLVHNQCRLPNDAVVVRGGTNLPENLSKGSGAGTNWLRLPTR